MAEPYGRTDTTVATTSWANASSKGNTAKPQDMKSRNTYIEVKLTSEQWWVLLFVVWIAISFVLITKAIMHNVTTGWHCPRNCDAFLTPFALSIATCVVPVFFCCPVLGAKGVWWLYIKRAADDDKHRQLHRVRKKCCCISISWIPKAANKRKKGSTHDSESVLPSYVKPGTAQEMDRDPGSPGRRRDDGTMHLPQPTERARLIASQHVQPEPQPRPQPEPEPEPETQEAVDAPVATLDLQADRLQQQAAEDPSTARVHAAQRATLQGPQTVVDVGRELAPRRLDRERANTVDDEDRAGIVPSARARVTTAQAAPAPAPPPSLAPLQAARMGRAQTPPRPLVTAAQAPSLLSAPPAQAAAANSLLARYRQKVDEQRGQPLRGGSVGGGTIQM